MASWQLEVFKMFLYVMFPVASFHIFNQPEIFDEWVTKAKKDLYLPKYEELEERNRQKYLEFKRKKLEEKKQQEMNI